MTSTLEQRKAALAMSILPPPHRERVLKSLPTQQRDTIRLLLDNVFSQGWNDPSAVELALGITTPDPSTIAIGSEQLIVLSRLLGAELYARVLVATDISDRNFLLSLLDRNYAVLVQRALGEVSSLPDSLKQSLLAAVHACLADAEGQPCAV